MHIQMYRPPQSFHSPRMVLGGDHCSGGSKQCSNSQNRNLTLKIRGWNKISESLPRGELSRVFEDTWGVSRVCMDVQKETGMYTSKT